MQHEIVVTTSHVLDYLQHLLVVRYCSKGTKEKSQLVVYFQQRLVNETSCRDIVIVHSLFFVLFRFFCPHYGASHAHRTSLSAREESCYRRIIH